MRYAYLIVPIWRLALIAVLALIAWQLRTMNREMATINSVMPQDQQVTTISEKLDKLDQDLEDLWTLTNEMVK